MNAEKKGKLIVCNGRAFMKLKNNNMKKIKEAFFNFIKRYVTRSRGNGCKCTHCVNYDFYKWAVVMECPCGCHTDDGMTGHDGLCCSIPNGLKKNNPHKHLEKAEYYKKILDEWNKDGM